ncbi:class I SAM-dependent methyltransferase [Lacticaseibacillus hegangensis]|uniref:Class I SAM-dependent methyltransferase n=1 Tax=Lacticaseibacillus hegangensis TaxID=2486010 RepID=A0ABW4D132_9LACO|nr:class I SAM-dependent methyltransferase [Lacticaseibacillus hegangensis]
MGYQDINADTVDGWVKAGWRWGQPIDHQTYVNAQHGQWDILLTPTRPMPHDWLFADMRGKKVLGLASGGGQQMPLLAAMGAEVTVLDYSQAQLQTERMLADHEGYAITIVRADMTQPLPFADEAFDLIIQPVANCYIEDVLPLWRECCRILKPGGRLLVGMDNGINYIVDEDREEKIIRGLPYNPLKDAKLMASIDTKEDGIQFSHTLDEQLRGQLQAGLSFKDMYEDYNGEGRLDQLRIPTFWASFAEKPAAR